MKEVFPNQERTPDQIAHKNEYISRQIAQSGDYEKIENNLKDQGLLENEIERVKSIFGEKIDAADFSDNKKSLWELLAIQELYDPDTAAHSVETYLIAKEKISKVLSHNIVLKKIIESEDVELEQFYFSCLTHDIGKVEIPSFIINNPIKKPQWNEQLNEILESESIPTVIKKKLELEVGSNPSKDQVLSAIKERGFQAEELVPVKFGITEQQAEELEKQWNISSQSSLMDILNKHAEFSEHILERKGLSVEAEIVGQHHHKTSDEEYPVSLHSLQKNSVMADLLHLADVEQALESSRSYKDKFTPLQVINAFIDHVNQGKIGKEIAYLWIKDEYEELIQNGLPQNMSPKDEIIKDSIEAFLKLFETGKYRQEFDKWAELHTIEPLDKRENRPRRAS